MSNNRKLGNLAQFLDSGSTKSVITATGGAFATEPLLQSDLTGTAPTGLSDSNLVKNLIDINHITETSGYASVSDAIPVILQNTNNIIPNSSGAYDLGDSAKPIAELILDSSANIFFGDLSLTSLLKSGTSSIIASAGAAWYGDRGLHIGGLLSDNVTSLNVIQYFDITSTGNATDFGDLSAAEYTSDACSNATYALNGGGYTTTLIDTIDYVTVATISNASDFGDLTQARSGISASSNGTYGLWKGGNSSGGQTTIDYVTIGTTSDATDFGDLTVGRFYGTSFANTTYALMAGGRISSSSNMQNTIDYVTVSTTGNATDFGDLGTVLDTAASASDSTYGVIGGGRDGLLPQDYQNIIQYVTIDTPSNATDFGDLTVARAELGGCGNATRGVFSGGYGNTNGIFNTIDYITIASPSNATDIGDLLQNIRLGCATAGSPS